MPTLGERLVTAVEQAEVDSALFKLFAQGGTAQDVVTEGGTYPSLAKFLDQTFRWQGDYTPGGTAYVKGQTFKEGNAIYRVVTNFTSTNFAGDSSNYQIMMDFDTFVQACLDAQTAAETAWNNFNARYLGAFASDPTLDNDGNALQYGAIYWNTSSRTLHVYDLGTGVWYDPVTSASDSADAASNSADDAAAIVPDLKAADNRRAFAGGVALDGVSGIATVSGLLLNQVSATPFTLHWGGSVNFLGSQVTNRPAALIGALRGVANFSPGTYGLCVASNGFCFRNEISGQTFVQTEPSDIPLVLGEFLILTAVVNPTSGQVDVYKNGTLATSATLTMDLSSARKYRVMGNLGMSDPTVFNQANGTTTDAGIFNRALSSTEVAELSDIGIGAWLAKYPEDQWGGDTILADGDMEDAGLTDSGLWSDPINATVTKSTASPHAGTQALRITSDGGSASRGFIRLSNSLTGFKVGQRVRVSGWARGDGSKARPEVSNPTASPTSVWLGTVSTDWQFFSVEFIIASANGLDINCDRADAGGLVDGDWVEFDDLVIQPAGTLAAYPMTEGIGRQLRDLSGRYDALLSATGFQHMQPKTEGFVRVKGADADPAMYMLEAGDIIPADSVVTDIIAEERKVAVANTEQDLADNRIRLNPSGSDLQIQRSDGTNHTTLGTVTAPTSLDDIDAEVHFKQQAR